jgi:hypothetical protein
MRLFQHLILVTSICLGLAVAPAAVGGGPSSPRRGACHKCTIECRFHHHGDCANECSLLCKPILPQKLH